MDQDEQTRAIARAAVNFVSATGRCDDADAWDDEPYCSESACKYCALARSMENYNPE